MQHRLRPAPAPVGLQLEHRTLAVVSAAPGGRAVEVAVGIEDQASVGTKPIYAVEVEAMQHLLRPAPAPVGLQLEYRPVVVSAAGKGSAVEIAGFIEDQTGDGFNPVCTVENEAMQH